MTSNAITRRITKLSDQWGTFAEDPAARLLYWQLTAAETSCFEAFLTLEADERTAEHTAVFLSLDTPFTSARTHGQALCQTLWRGYAASADALASAGLATRFELPRMHADEADSSYLIRTCRELLACYDIPGQLALVLRQASGTPPSGYGTWLVQLARQLPHELRLIVVDDPTEPQYPQLAAAEEPALAHARADLDMFAGLLELSRAAGGLETPGGQYRDLFLKLGGALQTGALEQALQLGAAALDLTEQHGLWHLAVPVHIALASALVANQRGSEAIQQCERAESAAERGQTSTDESTRSASHTLHLQSRLTHATILLALDRLPAAAAHFAETAQLAKTAHQPTMELDCHRLASFCHERRQDLERAREHAQRALSCAQTLTPAERAYANLPALEDALERLMVRPRPGMQMTGPGLPRG